ncbi:MAG: ABC transporter permease [Anaerolineales bacterium]|nr:ABC transporter permease [Anaerolineales bacterium]
MTTNTSSMAAESISGKIKVESPTQIAWRRFRQHKLAVVASFILLVIFILCYGAPLFTPYEPLEMNLAARNEPPSREHIFGTDSLGRDVYTRTIYGGRISLSVGLTAAAISITIGVLLGAISGYFGGRTDMVIMRITDVMMTFPPLIIMLTVAAFVGPGLINVILIIGGLRWPATTRLIRGQFLTLKNFEFIQAAHALGLPDHIIIIRHSLPNTIAPLMANLTFAVSAAILTEAGLSFLGLGVPLPIPSWGNLMQDARNLVILQNLPWNWIPAAIFTLVTILCINFIGDGMRDAFDPQQLIK